MDRRLTILMMIEMIQVAGKEKMLQLGTKKQSDSTIKNECRVDGSGNLLQVNEAINKSEIGLEEGQLDGNELMTKDLMEQEPSKYAMGCKYFP